MNFPSIWQHLFKTGTCYLGNGSVVAIYNREEQTWRKNSIKTRNMELLFWQRQIILNWKEDHVNCRHFHLYQLKGTIHQKEQCIIHENQWVSEIRMVVYIRNLCKILETSLGVCTSCYKIKYSYRKHFNLWFLTSKI